MTVRPQDSSSSSAIQAWLELSSTFQLSAPSLGALERLGYSAPTRIQSEGMALLLSGINTALLASRGEGKSTAWMLALLETLDWSGRVEAVVVVASEQRAEEVLAQFVALAGERAAAVAVAGTPEASRATVLIGRREALLSVRGLNRVSTLIVDRAHDFAYRQGAQQLRELVGLIARRRQLVFAAESNRRGLGKLATALGGRFDFVGGAASAQQELLHSCFTVSDGGLKRDLGVVLELYPARPVLFCCASADDIRPVARLLERFEGALLVIDEDAAPPPAELLEGARYVLCTEPDGAALRDQVFGLLVNIGLPDPASAYVERLSYLGSPARVVSLMQPNQVGSFYHLEKLYHIRFAERRLPSAEELASLRETRMVGQMLGALEQEAQGDVVEPFTTLAERLLERPNAQAMVARLLMHFHESTRSA